MSTDAQDPGAAPRLLAGGNPQIAKGYGAAPVQAWIAACPDWKQGVARQLDALVTTTLPEVEMAVKWNSPLYGMPGQGWFLSLHCMTRYIKVAFFNGAELQPPPPVASKQPRVRYLHVPEAGLSDTAQFIDWIRQASRLPGEKM